MRIPDADPGDQNHADSCGCGCGSATLLFTLMFTFWLGSCRKFKSSVISGKVIHILTKSGARATKLLFYIETIYWEDFELYLHSFIWVGDPRILFSVPYSFTKQLLYWWSLLISFCNLFWILRANFGKKFNI
jgi:hypothetical protein